MRLRVRVRASVAIAHTVEQLTKQRCAAFPMWRRGRIGPTINSETRSTIRSTLLGIVSFIWRRFCMSFLGRFATTAASSFPSPTATTAASRVWFASTATASATANPTMVGLGLAARGDDLAAFMCTCRHRIPKAPHQQAFGIRSNHLIRWCTGVVCGKVKRFCFQRFPLKRSELSRGRQPHQERLRQCGSVNLHP